jgi:hypothetical protein
MTHYTGANLYVSFKGTVISGDQTSFDFHDEMGMVDTSAGADAARTYLNTLLDGTAKHESHYEGGTAATETYNLCTPGAEGTLIVGPIGTTTNLPKITINSARVKSRDLTMPYDDNIDVSIDFQLNAAPSFGAW